MQKTLLITLLATPLTISAATYSSVVEAKSYVAELEQQAITQANAQTVSSPPNETVTDGELVSSFTKVIKQQERHNVNVVRSVRVLIDHYPEHIREILVAAYRHEPKHYRHIIRAAIHAQPALTQDVVITAIHEQMASAGAIVEIAIDAEPGYIDDIVYAAGTAAPDQLDIIVKTAVANDPQMITTVLRSANDSEPGVIASMIDTAMTAIPELGNYLVDSIMRIVPFVEQPKTTKEMEQERLRKTTQIVKGALEAGMTREELERSAIAAGIDPKYLEPALLELQYTPN